MHALLSENLLRNPAAGGQIRKIPVGIEGTRYIPLDNSHQIEEEFNTFLKKINAIKNPLEQSLFILVFVPYLQAFEDMNKRTSRISCNIPLLKANLLPISFLNINVDEYIHALKDIYEFNNVEKMRFVFIKAYQYSCEQYGLIKSKLVAPDPIASKYRNEIKNIVRQCVLTLKPFKRSELPDVSIEEKKKLEKIINLELESLHEGNLVRFGLRPSDLKKYSQSKK